MEIWDFLTDYSLKVVSLPAWRKSMSSKKLKGKLRSFLWPRFGVLEQHICCILLVRQIINASSYSSRREGYTPLLNERVACMFREGRKTDGSHFRDKLPWWVVSWPLVCWLTNVSKCVLPHCQCHTHCHTMMSQHHTHHYPLPICVTHIHTIYFCYYISTSFIHLSTHWNFCFQIEFIGTEDNSLGFSTKCTCRRKICSLVTLALLRLAAMTKYACLITRETKRKSSGSWVNMTTSKKLAGW